MVTTRDLLLHVVRLRIRLHSPFQLYTNSLKCINNRQSVLLEVLPIGGQMLVKGDHTTEANRVTGLTGPPGQAYHSNMILDDILPAEIIYSL